MMYFGFIKIVYMCVFIFIGIYSSTKLSLYKNDVKSGEFTLGGGGGGYIEFEGSCVSCVIAHSIAGLECDIA